MSGTQVNQSAGTANATGNQSSSELAFLSVAGEAADLIRATDWSRTAVGAPSMWPSSLKSIVGTMVHSRHPMFLWWGPELIQFYNDAYVPSFGRGKHPRAMGQRGRECWEEIWPIIGPQIEAVMTRGVPSWNEDALVPIFRNGRIEEVYWTYGYSPVMHDDGRIGGTLVVCTETTARVVAERRLRTLRVLADAVSACSEVAELVAAAFSVLRRERLDIPFALAYRFDAATSRWQLESSTLSDGPSLSAVDAAAREVFDGGGDRVTLPRIELADSPWPEPPSFAAVVRRKTAAGAKAFVFGLSSRLPVDAAYTDFLGQVVEQVDLAAARLEAFRARAAVEGERRSLLLQAPVGTALMTGPRHVFELANPLYRKIVGGRDIVGKAYLEAFPEIEGTPLAAVLDRVYETGESFVADEYLIPLDLHGDGTLVDCWFRFNLEPIRDVDGRVYGMMAVAVDITELVRARLVLEKANHEREALLEQLEAASRTKDEFLATVSHELRTPLTSILGWARILNAQGGADPARVAKGLMTIERNAQAQAQLIEDILDVSRIVSGKMRMSMRRLDARAVVRGAVETVRPTATAKGVTLSFDADESAATLAADEDRLQQIVWNLLSNAVKFTPNGGEVRAAVRGAGAEVSITVADTGKGIAPAFLPHVFDRFRQDDASTTKQQAGLGLGLAIVRHLVELHGGTVSARSEGAGKGATFEVRLPVTLAPAPSSAPGLGDGPERAAIARPSRGQLDGVRVLLVDDETDARELVAMVLEDAGATVVQAASVANALRVIDACEPDVLLSDIGMPGEDGYSFIQQIRTSGSSQRMRGLPAIALTAYARAEDRDRALGAGFQEHVAKPIDPRTLIAAVGALVRR